MKARLSLQVFTEKLGGNRRRVNQESALIIWDMCNLFRCMLPKEGLLPLIRCLSNWTLAKASKSTVSQSDTLHLRL
jgi:hypothetical protein